MKFRSTLILFIVMAVFCILPSMGAIKYLGGKPEMSAYVTGVNEFSPGDDATFSIKIQNSGVNSLKFLNGNPLTPDDFATTAKFLTLGLGSGGAPIQIKTDPQMVGDVATQGGVTITVKAKILANATSGEYQLPLTLKYKYAVVQDQEASDTIQLLYNDVTDTIPITIRVKPELNIDVLSATPENLNVGSEGYVDFTIKNIGSIDGKKATVSIIRNSNSMVIPTDSSVFVDDFLANSTITCRYKVAISSDAEAKAYPVDITVTYVDPEGETLTSASDTIGVTVGSKIRFTVISPAPVLYPGSTGVIPLSYNNAGTVTAYRAQARLNVVAPFSSADHGAYLGDIAPGATVSAPYAIAVGKDAPEGQYTIDTEIRYRDIFDNSQISDMFSVPVQVAPPSPFSTLVPVIVIAVVVVILAGAGYYLLKMRKKM